MKTKSSKIKTTKMRINVYAATCKMCLCPIEYKRPEDEAGYRPMHCDACTYIIFHPPRPVEPPEVLLRSEMVAEESEAPLEMTEK